MKVPAVASSVALISSATASLPVKVLASSADTGKEANPDHPAYNLVHRDSNDWTSAGALRAALTADALLHDRGGFAYVNRVNGKPVEILRLEPTSVSVDHDKISGEPFYVSGEGRNRKTYSYRDILHIQAPNGVSPIFQAREAIGLALVLEQHAGRLFSKGARPSGVLKFPKMLGEDAAKRIATGWHAAHAGENSGRTAILEEGGEFQALSFTSVDSQFAEMRAFQIVEIARAFRVPPHMIYDLGRATWSNSEQMNAEFLTYTLMPWIKIWEAAYTRVLLRDDERDSHSIEFVVDGLLRPDTATRASAYQVFRSAGIMTANEIRKLENLPPLPGGDDLTNPYTQSGTREQVAA